jgi:hypothetical protein
LDLQYVDEDFRADLGFVTRTGVLKNGNGFSYNFYPKRGMVSLHGPGALALFYWRPSMDWKKEDHVYNLYYNVNFKSQATLRADFRNNYTFLTFNFDPIRTPGSVPIPGNQGYDYNNLSLNYTSNPTKVFSYALLTSAGQFFNGSSYSASAILTYRIQPRALLSLNTRYDAIRLSEPHSDGDFWLVAPKVDITFTKSLFWSTLVQYSHLRDNHGLKSRLLLRFATL